MQINVIKNNKIIKQENENYIAKEGEILISDKDIDWPILKLTGGAWTIINRSDKKQGEIEKGQVITLKIKRKIGKDEEDNIIYEEKEIQQKEINLETDILIEVIPHPEKAKVYRGGTSVLTIGTDFNHEIEAIQYKYTKDELYIVNGKAKVKTPEMQIVEIRDKARIVLLQMAKDIQKLEEVDKPLLIDAGDWTDGDEAKLTDMKTDYQEALNDYNEVKTELLANAGSLEEIKLTKESIKSKLEKYNIKI